MSKPDLLIALQAWGAIEREMPGAPLPTIDGAGSETLFLWTLGRHELSLGFENDQPMWFWRGTMCGFKHFEPWDVDQPLPKWVASQLRIVKARS